MRCQGSENAGNVFVGRHVAVGEVGKVKRCPLEMRVRVDETGKDDAAMQIDPTRVFRRLGSDVVRRADSGNAAIGEEDRLRERKAIVKRPDAGIDKQYGTNRHESFTSEANSEPRWRM